MGAGGTAGSRQAKPLPLGSPHSSGRQHRRKMRIMSDTDVCEGAKEVRVGLRETVLGKVRLEQRPEERREGARWRAGTGSKQRDGQCKGPEAGAYLTWGDSKGRAVSGVSGAGTEARSEQEPGVDGERTVL